MVIVNDDVKMSFGGTGESLIWIGILSSHIFLPFYHIDIIITSHSLSFTKQHDTAVCTCSCAALCCASFPCTSRADYFTSATALIKYLLHDAQEWGAPKRRVTTDGNSCITVISIVVFLKFRSQSISRDGYRVTGIAWRVSRDGYRVTGIA
jgi:hypothetical protein